MMPYEYGFDQFGEADEFAQKPGKTTLGALRGAGFRYHSVKTEIRENMIARLSMGQSAFPDIIGMDDDVLPDLERALLSLHDVLVIGARGQGKTTLMRGLIGLLDVWLPYIDGSELHEHPMHPQSDWAKALVEEMDDETPVDWLHRSFRYAEKLATPDVTISDLIGDVDPGKLTEGRSLDDPDVIHYGMIPAMNRGIIGLDEIPSLAPRAQAALMNVMEEREVQVRGYSLRLPIDVIIIASANPEDYTRRGQIISPLRDRFGAQIKLHYPLTLEQEIELLNEKAELGPRDSNLFIPQVPRYLIEIIARFVQAVREAPEVDQRSGVGARFGIAALETVGGSSVRRASLHREDPIARICDVATVVNNSLGKIDFEDSAEGHEVEILTRLLRQSIAQTCRNNLGEVDLTPLQAKFDEGMSLTTGPDVSAEEVLRQLGTVPGFATLLDQLGIPDGAESPGLAAGAVEFALEGLFLNNRLTKGTDAKQTVYKS
jgi:magnesium chelatase subunit I